MDLLFLFDKGNFVIEVLQMLLGIIERGFIFSCMAASVYTAARLINFENLAVEGAFGLGGACTAYLICSGYNPWISLVVAVLAGALSGIVTGLLHTKLDLNKLISGIVVTTGLFSVSLKIAGSNMTLSNKATIFSFMPSFLAPCQALCLFVIMIGGTFIAIQWFLKTEVGYLLQAAGDAPEMLANIGKNVDFYIIMGLTLSNMLAALSGSLFVQYSGYFSILSMVGVLIIGLAGMIFAQTISSEFGTALIVGSVAYQAILALTFELQFDQDWNKLITAIFIILLIIINQSLHKK